MSESPEDIARTIGGSSGPVGDVARLQALAMALVGATTTAEVSVGIIDQGITALGANAGALAVVTPSGTELEILRAAGYPPEVVEQLRRLDRAAPVAFAT